MKVYVIYAASANRLKIGISSNPEKRLSDLQVGSPVPLELVYCWEEEDAPSVERQLHQRLSLHAAHGEWFEADQQVWDTLAAYGCKSQWGGASSFGALGDRVSALYVREKLCRDKEEELSARARAMRDAEHEARRAFSVFLEQRATLDELVSCLLAAAGMKTTEYRHAVDYFDPDEYEELRSFSYSVTMNKDASWLIEKFAQLSDGGVPSAVALLLRNIVWAAVAMQNARGTASSEAVADGIAQAFADYARAAA